MTIDDKVSLKNYVRKKTRWPLPAVHIIGTTSHKRTCGLSGLGNYNSYELYREEA